MNSVITTPYRGGGRREGASTPSIARWRAAATASAGLVLSVGSFLHPYIQPPTDEAVLGAVASADPLRWGFAHLVIGGGYGVVILAFIAVRSHLRDLGEHSWSHRALPFVVVGSASFVMLTGIELALVATVETNGDVARAQHALMPWFVPVLVVGSISFLVGAFGFAKGIQGSRMLGPLVTRFVVGALIAMAVARFVPLGVSQYVLGVAGIVALCPLSFAMRSRE